MVLYYVQTPPYRRRHGWYSRIFFDKEGRSSLLSFPEAKKVLARIGGTLHEVDFGDIDVDSVPLLVKHWDIIQDVIEQLEEAELPLEDAISEETTEDTDEEEIEAEDEPEAPEEPEEEEVPEVNAAQVQNLAEEEEVEFPTYNEMRKELSAADKDPENPFDLTSVVGDDHSKESLQKAYLVLKLQEQGE